MQKGKNFERSTIGFVLSIPSPGEGVGNGVAVGAVVSPGFAGLSTIGKSNAGITTSGIFITPSHTSVQGISGFPSIIPSLIDGISCAQSYNPATSNQGKSDALAKPKASGLQNHQGKSGFFNLSHKSSQLPTVGISSPGIAIASIDFP